MILDVNRQTDNHRKKIERLALLRKGTKNWCLSPEEKLSSKLKKH